jgi:hypothetical protein
MSYTHGDGKNKYSVPWKADSRWVDQENEM